MKKILIFALLGLAAAGVQAERADVSKQAVILWSTMHVDDVARTTVLAGDVVVTKGTLVLNAEKALVKQTPEEDIMVTLTAAPGKKATFRQKRDGGPDLWIEGEAQRIEYDERAAVMKLFGAAKIRQTEGGRLENEIQGEFISYDSLREKFDAHNESAGGSKVGGSRGMMIIAPRKPRPAAPAVQTPAAPAAPVTPTGAP
ncbi:MAG: lipopolysaccharide transport periplasmic protein LptA [Pseudomonadota bacterium]